MHRVSRPSLTDLVSAKGCCWKVIDPGGLSTPEHEGEEGEGKSDGGEGSRSENKAGKKRKSQSFKGSEG